MNSGILFLEEEFDLLFELMVDIQLLVNLMIEFIVVLVR